MNCKKKKTAVGPTINYLFLTMLIAIFLDTFYLTFMHLVSTLNTLCVRACWTNKSCGSIKLSDYQD